MYFSASLRCFLLPVAVATLILMTPRTSAAAELPPASNFDAGKVLKAADLKSVLQNILDLKGGVLSSLFSVKTGAASTPVFNADLVRRAFNSSTERRAIQVSSNLPSGLTWFFDDYGFLHGGDLSVDYAGLSLAPATGPAFRLVGDILAGDYIYFGSVRGDGSDLQQIGVRARGATPSNTLVKTAVDANADSTGGAYIALHPDSSLPAIGERGGLELFAFGSQITGPYSNAIRFGNRSGPNTITTRMVIANDGDVGIGTPDPSAKLDVDGSIRIGNSSHPTGITLYDTATGVPYCIRITNGALISTNGQCPI